MAKNRVTIIDVAREAGVDNSTVSLALRNDPRIRPSTQQRIREAAARLNYVPNHLARSLQNGRSRVLGVLLSDMHPFFSSSMEEFNAVATAASYTLSVKIYEWNAEREQQCVTEFCESRVEGLVWVPSNRSTPRFAEMVQCAASAKIPLVALGLTDRETTAQVHEVGVSTIESVRQGLRFLRTQGHRRIAVATATQVPGQRGELHRNRLRLIRHAATELKVTLEDRDILETPDNEYGGVGLAKAFADRPGTDRPTAIFAADDMLARAAVAGLHILGLEIPRDISVLGYDDAPGDRDGPIPISSINLNSRQVARTAMDLLFKLIAGRGASAGYQSIAIKAQMVKRSSVGRVTQR